MKAELIIIWESGEKESYLYNSPEEARIIEQGYKAAFGNQIAWTGINERRV